MIEESTALLALFGGCRGQWILPRCWSPQFPNLGLQLQFWVVGCVEEISFRPPPPPRAHANGPPLCMAQPAHLHPCSSQPAEVVTGPESVQYVSPTEVQCRQPQFLSPFPRNSYLEVSVDGQKFSHNLKAYDIVGPPMNAFTFNKVSFAAGVAVGEGGCVFYAGPSASLGVGGG